jgi:hypothetical protein
MLTLIELYGLLELNNTLTKRALNKDNFKRVVELGVHRALVRDMIIECLENMVIEEGVDNLDVVA